LFLGNLCTKDSSTFCSAAREDLSAIAGRHPFSKSKLVFSFPPMRLIGTLHDVFLSIFLPYIVPTGRYGIGPEFISKEECET
jgi:hypothetical protein